MIKPTHHLQRKLDIFFVYIDTYSEKKKNMNGVNNWASFKVKSYLSDRNSPRCRLEGVGVWTKN